MKTARLVALTVLGTALALAGCTKPSSETATPAPRTKPSVALVLKTLNITLFVYMEKGDRDEAARLDVELVVQAAEREVDVDKQMQIIENIIQTWVDALCITPSGSKEVVLAIAKANAAKIP